MTSQRLSKVLANAGVASRRACETLIFDGHVTVNGVVTLVPQHKVSLDTDTICVDNIPISQLETKVYFLLNKPRDFLCSNKRRKPNEKLVIDLFTSEPYRLFTVGRLDKDTQGLLIVTNDGNFANRLIHPSSEIEKEYVATTHPIPSGEQIAAIEKGCIVEECFVKPRKVVVTNSQALRITVMEGKKREIRILLKEAGLQTISLTRIRIGPLCLPRELQPGQWRALSKEELSLFVY